MDDFFRIYQRAKFADNEDQYKSFEGDYHYQIYRRNDILDHFGCFKDTHVLHNRILKEINYFARLYQELRTDYSPEREHLFYNKLLEQNQQYLLILSAVSLNDPQKEEKIYTIAAKFDQLHVILRLLDLYESNTFQRLVYRLNKDLRNKSAKDCRSIFDNLIVEAVKEEGLLPPAFSGKVEDIFTFERFKGMHNTSANFSKYILMRIERWLINLLDKPSYCREGLKELEERFNKSTRRRYGMHLEHIYARNDANKGLFTNATTGVFDEASFEQTRNMLGMVLLLKDLQNLSSGADLYRDKLSDYSTSDLIWNQLLAGHIPSVDQQILPPELRSVAIQPLDGGVFPRDKVEERQKLVFEAIKHIWANV